jgi:hypothetical protein
MPAKNAERELAVGLQRLSEEKLNLRQGVDSVASGGNLGDYFQYAVDAPVSLPRQKSAMIPILTKQIDAQRVSIYNERVLAKFPLRGLRLKNTTDLHLTQGPITVFEGSTYAGDTRILDLQPKEERLVSYAIDLGTEVVAVPHSDNGRLTSVKVHKGILHTVTKLRESKTYTVTNRSEQDRLVLIEQAFRPEFTLVDTEKPKETARDVYRFELKSPKGETVKKTITEERVIGEALTLTSLDDNRIRVTINNPACSAKVKKALQKALSLKWALDKTRQDIGNEQRDMDRIKGEQPRIRQNLEKLPNNDPLAKRLRKKLDEQETEIEKHEAAIKKLNHKADGQRKDYEDYLANLSVE